MIALRHAVIAAFALALACVRIEDGEPVAPKRPKSVPQHASWCGGADGGVFIRMARSPQPGLYTGTVYADVTGDIWYQGRFQLKPKGVSQTLDFTKPGWCKGWDGAQIILGDDRSLRALDTDEQ
jgi:hypothetical protein